MPEYTPDALIKAEEGLLLKPYRCSEHKLTIGYGFNMEANPLPADIAAYLKANKAITQDMAERLFQSKYAEAIAEAMKVLGSAWSSLGDARKAVVISMIYQLGEAGFEAFKRTIAYIKAGDFLHAAWNMLQSKWEDQTEQRVHRAALMMATGQWLLP